MFTMRLTVSLAAIAATSVGLSPAAHADEQSFIDYLNSNGGRPVTAFWDGPLIQQGYSFCGMIRGGMPVDQVKATNFGWSVNVPLFVDAAQRELCPDTLG